MDCSPPGCSVHGILQARILEWVAISFSRGSSQWRDWTLVSCIERWILSPWGQPRKPPDFCIYVCLLVCTCKCMCVHVFMNVNSVHMMHVVIRVCTSVCLCVLTCHPCAHAYVCVYIHINYIQTEQNRMWWLKKPSLTVALWSLSTESCQREETSQEG